MPQTQPESKANRRKKVRWGHVALLAGLVLLIPLLLWVGWRCFHPLELKGETYTVQFQEDFDPYGNIKSLFLGSTDDVRFSGNVDTNTSTPTTVDASYIYRGKTYPFTVEITDSKGPELKLKEYTADTSQSVVAEDFVESVSDPSGYTLAMRAEDDITEPGYHSITVTAKDNLGNETVKTTRLKRVQDESAPILENFEETSTLPQGGSYLQKNYTAADDIDPNPMVYVDVSALNASEVGSYPVTYTVRDRSGNTKTYTQTVEVTENPDFGKKICYLTFDDGPSENTLKILDILKQYDVHATFFVTGANPDYYSVMKQIVDDGNTIALHTFSHDYASVYASDEAYFEDLQKISDLVEQETGQKADVIRFPGGSSNAISASYSDGIMTRLVDEVNQHGYQYFDWNVDSTDASGENIPVETLVANATAGIGMQDVCILMHDTAAKDTTVEALPQIIEAYKADGYIFRGLTINSTPVHHTVNN